MSTSSRQEPSFNQVALDCNLSERFTALRNQELGYITNDYLSNIRDCARKKGKQVVDEKCRYTMAIWSLKFIEFYNLSEETASVAMSHLDRFLSSEQGQFALYDRRLFQLAVISSLQIAAKVNEPEKIDVDTFLLLGSGLFTIDEVVLMEKKILSALDWRLCPPTPYIFLDLLFDLISSIFSNDMKHSILELARKQIFLSIPDYSFSMTNPSSIAFGSLINAMELVNGFPRDARRDFICNLTKSFTDKNIEGIIFCLRKKLLSFFSTTHEPRDKALNYAAHNMTESNYTTKEFDSPVCVRHLP